MEILDSEIGGNKMLKVRIGGGVRWKFSGVLSGESVFTCGFNPAGLDIFFGGAWKSPPVIGSAFLMGFFKGEVVNLPLIFPKVFSGIFRLPPVTPVSPRTPWTSEATSLAPTRRRLRRLRQRGLSGSSGGGFGPVGSLRPLLRWLVRGERFAAGKNPFPPPKKGEGQGW